MRQVVGISQKIRRAWVDATLDRLVQTTDESELRTYLDKYLKDDLPGKESRAKAIGIVLRIWSGIPRERVALRDAAVALLPRISGQERIWLHWGMTALAYPFFRDTAEVIGRLLALQDDFTTAQVQGRMLTTWGDRQTNTEAVQKLITSLLDWEVLRSTKQKGHFLLARKMTASVPDLQLWLLEALLGASAAEEIEAQHLLRLPESFPFTLSVRIAELRKCDRFNIHRQGLDRDMVSLRKVKLEQPTTPSRKTKKAMAAELDQPSLFDKQAEATIAGEEPSHIEETIEKDSPRTAFKQDAPRSKNLTDLPEVQKLLHHADRLIEASEEQLKAVTTTQGKVSEVGYQVLAHVALLHVRELLAASGMLLRGGFARPAMNLWRSIFESLVTLIYVDKKRDDRVSLFWGHSPVQRKRLLDGLLKHKRLDPKFAARRTAAEIERIEKDYAAVKDRYPRKTSWSGVQIAEMAEEVGAGDLYRFEYGYLCDEVHCGALALSTRYTEGETGAIALKVDEQPYLAVPTFHRAIEWTFQVALIHAALFSEEQWKTMSQLKVSFDADFGKAALEPAATSTPG